MYKLKRNNEYINDYDTVADGKKVHFYNFGLWTHKLSDVGSQIDQKTCEEVKRLKRF